MKVYVIDQNNNPLMPCSPREARVLLKNNKAKVIKRTPFTIQLNFGSSCYKQDIVLGIDAGSKFIGVSATTEKYELFSAEVQLRNDIVDLLATRKQFRISRRAKTTRYRQPRFLNRVKSKHKGWLAPSIENKIQGHFKVIKLVNTILPVTKTIVETASFDIQRIKNPEITGADYQQGEQLNFWNVRQYVLFRDGYACHGKKGCTNKILNVHHIESRKTGGNRPKNLITLCEQCHKDFHSNKLKLDLKKTISYRDASFMGIMRWSFYNRLKEMYSNVNMTYGYITKNTRITNNLPKEHRLDALCITGNPKAKRLDTWYFMKQVRKRNRQIHKASIIKGGKRKLNQSPFEIFGFRLFDKVLLNKKECFIFGRRASGYFDLRTLDRSVISASTSYKKLILLEKRKSFIIERS